jgi:hypothetical protein
MDWLSMKKLGFTLVLDSAQQDVDKRIVSRTSKYLEGVRSYELVNSFCSELQWKIQGWNKKRPC